MTSKKSPPEVSTTSDQANLLCTLPRTTLLSKQAMGQQQRTGYHPVADLCTTTPSMQVTVNPYSYGMLATSNNCDTDNESQYASVVYSPSPVAAARTTNSRFNSRLNSNTMSPRNQAYLSPQLARLNSTLRSNNGSPVHNRYHNSAMSSTTTLSTCLSPRSGRYEAQQALEDQANHVYCEIPLSSSKQLDRLRLQQQLRAKLRQHNNPSSLDNETEFFEDSCTTQCDLHNISDLSDDEVNQQTFSELSFQHSNNCSPKHYPRRLNNASPGSSHNSRKSRAAKAAHQHLSPPPLKSSRATMSQLPATDV